MTAKRRGTVYSTDTGRVCPKCGWSQDCCRCASVFEEPVPDRLTVRLRLERAGRKGKTVTVVEGLPRNTAFVKGLAAELKRACGSGGTAGAAHVEIQGDHLATLRRLLGSRGWQVKG